MSTLDFKDEIPIFTKPVRYSQALEVLSEIAEPGETLTVRQALERAEKAGFDVVFHILQGGMRKLSQCGCLAVHEGSGSFIKVNSYTVKPQLFARAARMSPPKKAKPRKSMKQKAVLNHMQPRSVALYLESIE